jgi:23S rRNA (cytosine1962-C5)-methyltransferase
MSHHPTIRLKPREGRRLRGGAPWAFSNEIVMDQNAKSLAPGTLVNVAGDDGRAFGTGYFNPKSLIAVRMLDDAADAAVDQAFFEARFAHALKLREAQFAQPFYRLAHAEGDRLPGVTIDRFGSAAIVQITTAGMECLREPLLKALESVVAPEAIVLRNDAQARALEGLENEVRTIKGDAGRLVVEENGVRFFFDPLGGQKTGWYYDQRDNRAFSATLAPGRTVLDAYCYTGGFSLVAAKAGAREVVAFDSSQPALALAEESAAANRLSAKFVRCDVFEELTRLGETGERFGLVIADPPPFVRARKDLEAGAKAYRKLARLAAQLVEKDGFLLLASCSHNMPAERFSVECAMGIARAGRKAALIRQAGAGIDHPIHPFLPESAYLKVLVYALD